MPKLLPRFRVVSIRAKTAPPDSFLFVPAVIETMNTKWPKNGGIHSISWMRIVSP